MLSSENVLHRPLGGQFATEAAVVLALANLFALVKGNAVSSRFCEYISLVFTLNLYILTFLIIDSLRSGVAGGGGRVGEGPPPGGPDADTPPPPYLRQCF